MSFPPIVKEKVLVACARHCCLCRKFAGLKIEIHHIQEKADGGEDTFENAIPLCFDCHADMRSYDHKHPKGTKYTREGHFSVCIYCNPLKLHKATKEMFGNPWRQTA